MAKTYRSTTAGFEIHDSQQIDHRVDIVFAAHTTIKRGGKKEVQSEYRIVKPNCIPATAEMWRSIAEGAWHQCREMKAAGVPEDVYVQFFWDALKVTR